MPRTFGDGLVHSSHIDVLVEGDEPLGEIPPPSLTPEIHEIAKLIADNLVEDGATIQTGKGDTEMQWSGVQYSITLIFFSF